MKIEMRGSMLRLSSSKLMRTSGTGGFTLIEILVAITILSIVLTSVYGIFGSVSAAKTRLDRDSTDYHTARVVFDRFSRELHGAYYRGDDQTTFFRGGRDNNGETFLELTTTAVTPLSAVGTGIAEVRYRLEADEELSNNLQVLMRAEKPRQSSSTIDDDRMMRLAPSRGVQMTRSAPARCSLASVPTFSLRAMMVSFSFSPRAVRVTNTFSASPLRQAARPRARSMRAALSISSLMASPSA